MHACQVLARSRMALGDRVVRIGLALVLLQLLYRGWALSGSFFYFDDLAFLSRAQAQPPDWHYLTESYGGHLMPAGFAVVWALTRTVGWSWPAWAGVLLLLQAVAGVGMLRLLVSMFGRRVEVLVLLAAYLAWVFTLSAGIWFAAGINQLPLQIALVYGLHAFLRHLRTRRVAPLVVSVAWTVAGLLFYEKTLLVVGVYALVALCWFCRGNTPERLLELWRRYRLAVVVYAVVAIGYAAAYAVLGLDFSPGGSAQTALTPLTWNLVAVAFSAAVVGGPFSWQSVTVGSLANPPAVVQAVGWVVVVGLVSYAARTRTRSRRAWSLICYSLAANVVLLATARANIVGPDIGREYRYQTESAAVLVLAIGLAFLPLKGARERNRVRTGVATPYEDARRLGIAAAVLVLAATASSARYVHQWQRANPTRDFVAHVKSSLARHTGSPVAVVDQGLPQTLLWSYRYPENTYSHVFRDLGRGRVRYVDQAVDHLYVFGDDGRLAPLAVPPTRQLAAHRGCYRLGGTTTTLPLNGPVIGAGWWVQVSYQAPEPFSVRVQAGEEAHRLELPAGLHNFYVTATGSFRSLTLADHPAMRGACVTAVSLGLPEAAEGGS